jgi:predicted transcriptional regulator of viral defense system
MNTNIMKSRWLESYCEDLLSSGRITFTLEDLRKSVHRTERAILLSTHKLQKQGRLVKPRQGFYVIVDPLHRSLGCQPFDDWIRQLMDHMNCPYYVGLLAAAMRQGSSHQMPQAYQVVVPRKGVRSIRCGPQRIRFIYKKSFEAAECTGVNSASGEVRYSTPETTAWDLAFYARLYGGHDRLVTLLSELAPGLDGKKLRIVCDRHRVVSMAQRLGYILEALGRAAVAAPLAPLAAKAAPIYLDPASPRRASGFSNRWNVWLNAAVEPEA